MKLGTITKNGAKHCIACEKPIKSEKEIYCFVCGNPLKEEAILLEIEKQKTVKLQLISSLVKQIDDKKALDTLLQTVNQIKDEI